MAPKSKKLKAAVLAASDLINVPTPSATGNELSMTFMMPSSRRNRNSELWVEANAGSYVALSTFVAQFNATSFRSSDSNDVPEEDVELNGHDVEEDGELTGHDDTGEQSTPPSDHAVVDPSTIENQLPLQPEHADPSTIENQLPLQPEHAEATGEPSPVVKTKVQSSILSFLSRR